MRLVVKLPVGYRRGRRSMEALYNPFTCVAVKLYRGPVETVFDRTVWADVLVPEDAARTIEPWAKNADGTYRAEAPIAWNTDVLPPLLARDWKEMVLER